MYKGEIEIVKQDVNTLEVLGNIKKKNTITLKALYLLLMGLDRSSNTPHSLSFLPYGATDSVTSRFIIGAPRGSNSTASFIGAMNVPENIDINEATPDIRFSGSSFFAVPVTDGEDQPRVNIDNSTGVFELTFKGRLNPPSSGTRTFNLVYLTAPGSAGTSASSYNYPGFAIMLDTPCIQQDNEILEFFYRVSSIRHPKEDPSSLFWTGYFSQRLWGNAYSDFINGNRIGESPGSSTPSTPFRIGDASSGGVIDIPIFTSNVVKSRKKMVRNAWRSHISKNSTGITRTSPDATDLSQLSGLKNFNFGINDAIGETWNSISYLGGWHGYANFNGNSNRSMYTFSHRFIPEDISPIQNVYHKRADNNRPYLQPSFVAESTGTINIEATNFEKKAPYLYKINFIDEGQIGTASYNFYKKINFGFPNSFYEDENLAYKNLLNFPVINFSSYSPDNTIFWGTVHNRYENFLSNNEDLLHCVPGLGSSSLEEVFGFPNMQKYDEETVIIADPYGLSVVDIYKDDYFNIDEYTTPELETEELNGFCIDNDKNIWIATLDKGLFRLSSDFQTLTSITIPDPEINDQKCYCVDFKNNGDIWAIYDGGLAKSSDLGVTWATYHETSTTPFVFPGITDNNWDNVQGIVIDKDHPDDRLAVILYRGNIIWWSRESSVAINSNTSLDTNTDVFRGRFSQTERAFPIGKLVKHFPNSDIFVAKTINLDAGTPKQFRSFRFGQTGLLSNWDTGPALQVQEGEIVFMETAQNELGVLTVFMEVVNNVTNNAVFSIRNPENFSVMQTFSAKWNANDVLESVVTIGRRRGSILLCHMGDGIFIHSGHRFSMLRVARLLSSSVASGGDIEHIMWQKYGWNDVSGEWELGIETPKPMHSDLEPLVDGLEVSFNAGNYVAGEYVEAYIYDGIHKDNATAVSFSVPFHFRYAETLEDLSTNTVPVSPPGLRENVELNFNTCENVAEEVNKFMYQANGRAGYIRADSGSSNTPLANAISEIIFEGDFSISFKTHPNGWSSDRAEYAIIGVVPLSQVPNFNTGLNLNHFWWFRQRVARAQNGTLAGGTVSHIGDVTPLNKDTVYTIERVGSDIHYKLDGTIVHTVSGANTEPMVVGISFNREPCRTFHEMNIDYYTENNITVFLGNEQNSTGIFDPDFGMVEGWLRPSTTRVQINQVPAIVTHDTTLSPLPGEVIHRGKSGMLIFNEADIGKDITAKYQALYKLS